MTRALFASILLAGCGTATQAVTTNPDTTSTSMSVTVELDAVLPAAATMPAVRVTTSAPATTIAPFDPIGYVNGLAYGWTLMDPAMDAYRVVALSRGWTDATVARWAPFVFDVISKESGGCPNTVGGDLFVVGTCDQYTRKGHAEDSGISQATASLWGRDGVLCAHEGLCSQWSIISSPWSSFVSMVASLELLGSFPWCWSNWARTFHQCSLVGAKERPL